MHGVHFFGDIDPKYLPDAFLDSVSEALQGSTVTFVPPAKCSDNMTANLKRTNNDALKWYLSLSFTRQTALSMVAQNIPLPFRIADPPLP